jgi:hypothetical protein
VGLGDKDGLARELLAVGLLDAKVRPYVVPNLPCPSSTDSGTAAAFDSANDICAESPTSTTQIRAEGDGVRHGRRRLLPWQSLILRLFRGQDMLGGCRWGEVSWSLTVVGGVQHGQAGMLEFLQIHCNMAGF